MGWTRPAGLAVVLLGLWVLVAVPVLRVVADPALPPWMQSGGDDHHAGLAPVSRNPIDVVQVFHLGTAVADGGDVGFVVTPPGAVGLGVDGGTCQLILVVANDTQASVSNLGSAISCPSGARLVGYDALTGTLLVCVDGTYPGSPGLPQQVNPTVHLAAFTLQGEPSWTLAPKQEFNGIPDGRPGATWGCRGVAVSPGQVVVPYSAADGSNRVEEVDLSTRKALWSEAVPLQAFLPNATMPSAPASLPLPGTPAGGFVAQSATRTDTGVVVSGRLSQSGTAGSVPALAWFGVTGRLNGAESVGTAVATPASVRLAARLQFGVEMVADQLVVVNPANAVQPASNTVQDAKASSLVQAGPAWTRDGILVPAESGLFLVDKSGFSHGHWADDSAGRVEQVMATPDAQALVLIARQPSNGPAAELVRLGIRSGLNPPVLDQILLPLNETQPEGAALQLHALPLGPDRLLAWDDAGEAALLGPEPTVPRVSITVGSDYPATNDQVQVTLGTPTINHTTLLLSWGDTQPEPDPVEGGATVPHSFAEGGDHDVRLTAVYPDGRTATTSHTIHVGQSAPNCGLLCQAFKQENQNYTFFVLGLFLTIVGAGFTAIAATRGRRRLERYLRQLDIIRKEGRLEPLVAIRDLHNFRAGLRYELGRGKLQDGQYALIDRHGTELLAILRQRMLGTFLSRVSEGFRHALDLALMDGVIEERERQTLVHAAQKEGALSPSERAALVKTIQGWALPL
ncbi:MAG: PKD domain-containing protein [Thermoplasmatota archaeon]